MGLGWDAVFDGAIPYYRPAPMWKQTEGRTGSRAQARFRTKDNPPRLFAQDTDYGVLVGGKYAGAEGEDYWRYNLFLMPFYSMPPGGKESSSAATPGSSRSSG